MKAIWGHWRLWWSRQSHLEDFQMESTPETGDARGQCWRRQTTLDLGSNGFRFSILAKWHLLCMSIQEKLRSLSIAWSTLLAWRLMFQNVNGIVSIGMCDNNERLREGKAVESKWTQLLNWTQFPRRSDEWFTQFDVTKLWLFSFVTWPKSGTDSGWVHSRAQHLPFLALSWSTVHFALLYICRLFTLVEMFMQTVQCRSTFWHCGGLFSLLYFNWRRQGAMVHYSMHFKYPLFLY